MWIPRPHSRPQGAGFSGGSYAMELFEYRDVPHSIAEQIMKAGG